MGKAWGIQEMLIFEWRVVNYESLIAHCLLKIQIFVGISMLCNLKLLREHILQLLMLHV